MRIIGLLENIADYLKDLENVEDKMSKADSKEYEKLISRLTRAVDMMHYDIQESELMTEELPLDLYDLD